MRVRVTFTEIEGNPEVEFDIPESCESIAYANKKRDESGAEGWDAVAVFERGIAECLKDGMKVDVCGHHKTKEGLTSDIIAKDISNERARQDAKWGGAAHDDFLRPCQWRSMISEYNGKAWSALWKGQLLVARKRFVQVAALAVAAIESIDRKIQEANR